MVGLGGLFDEWPWRSPWVWGNLLMLSVGGEMVLVNDHQGFI